MHLWPRDSLRWHAGSLLLNRHDRSQLQLLSIVNVQQRIDCCGLFWFVSRVDIEYSQGIHVFTPQSRDVCLRDDFWTVTWGRIRRNSLIGGTAIAICIESTKYCKLSMVKKSLVRFWLVRRIAIYSAECWLTSQSCLCTNCQRYPDRYYSNTSDCHIDMHMHTWRTCGSKTHIHTDQMFVWDAFSCRHMSSIWP